MFKLCKNTTRPSPRQRSHSRLDPSEVLRSDGATAGACPADDQAGGQTRRLHLHDAAGPARRRDHHVITTTRRTASQPSRYPCRRLHGSSLARSGAAIPSSRQNATPCCPQNSQTTSCTHAKTPADRPAQHRAALRFTLALASLDLGLCLGRPSAQTAAAGSLCQRQHLPPPQSVQVFGTPAAA